MNLSLNPLLSGHDRIPFIRLEECQDLFLAAPTGFNNVWPFSHSPIYYVIQAKNANPHACKSEKVRALLFVGPEHVDLKSYILS